MLRRGAHGIQGAIHQNIIQDLDTSAKWVMWFTRVHFLNELRTDIINLAGNRQSHDMRTIHKYIKLTLTMPFTPQKTTNGLILYVHKST